MYLRGTFKKKRDLCSDYEGRCGNCHKTLEPNDKYCRYCGTQVGKGAFMPYKNSMVCLYAAEPVVMRYKCEKCGMEWSSIGWIEGYCSNCGAKVSGRVDHTVGNPFSM